MLADIFAQALQKKGDDNVNPQTTAKMAAQGRDGDSLIAHINPREAAILKAIGGRGSINPKTGALEFAFDDSGALGGSAMDQYGYSDQNLSDFNDRLGESGFANSDSGMGGWTNNAGWMTNQGYYSPPAAMQDPYGLAQYGNMDLTGGAATFNNRFDAGGDLAGLGNDNANLDPSAYSGLDMTGSSSAPTAADGSPSAPAAPSTAGAAAPGGQAAAGGINPEASIGYNPLSAWQASYGIDAGQQPALTRLDSGEVVYGEDQPSLGNLRGTRDNTNFQVDGFQRAPGDDLSVANVGSGGLDDGGSDGIRQAIATWSGVGPAGFGPTTGAGGAVAQPGAFGPNPMPNDNFATQVPQMERAYRDMSSFNRPMATAMQEAYDNNPNLPQGYLEGMYGVESSYGKNMQRPGSQYAGPFQFSAANMASAAPQLAPVSRADLMDPYANMDALQGEFANMARALGRNPTAQEAYTMHQQGVTGGARAISNPGTPMTQLGTPARALTANGLPPNAAYNDFIAKFGTPFSTFSNYDPNVTSQGPGGVTSMFR